MSWPCHFEVKSTIDIVNGKFYNFVWGHKDFDFCDFVNIGTYVQIYTTLENEGGMKE